MNPKPIQKNKFIHNKIAINNKIHKKEINFITYIKIRNNNKNRIINKIINLILKVLVMLDL